MTDATPGSGAPSSNRNVMIVLSYLWLLALIPLVVEIVLMLLGTFLSCLVGIFIPIIGLGFLILHIVAIMRGISGQRLIVPGISQYADRF